MMDVQRPTAQDLARARLWALVSGIPKMTGCTDQDLAALLEDLADWYRTAPEYRLLVEIPGKRGAVRQVPWAGGAR